MLENLCNLQVTIFNKRACNLIFCNDKKHVSMRVANSSEKNKKISRFGVCLQEFDDYRDADDAVYELNGKELLGER